MNRPPWTILYCHCRYAQVVPAEVKEEVLRELCDSGLPFEAVPDLCELSARGDPSLRRMAAGPLKIAACYPRAVKWLFASARAPLAGDACEVLNMRVLPAAAITSALKANTLNPNLPTSEVRPDSEKSFQLSLADKT
jgi:hypothetical protein